MIEIRKAEDRGHANHGWLNSAHTFSFANYFDPKQMGFSDLLVINDDRVAPGRGFGSHPHNDMEIFSYVLKGSLSHKDSMGNADTLYPGDIQLMSAGSGVVHSEMNGDTQQAVHFLQIWIVPNVQNTPPRYQQLHITEADKRGKLHLFISPQNQDNTLTIQQDTAIYAGKFLAGDEFLFPLTTNRYYYLHVATGNIEVNGILLQAGDGAKIRQEESLHFTKGNDADVLLFDLRPHETPKR